MASAGSGRSGREARLLGQMPGTRRRCSDLSRSPTLTTDGSGFATKSALDVEADYYLPSFGSFLPEHRHRGVSCFELFLKRLIGQARVDAVTPSSGTPDLEIRRVPCRRQHSPQSEPDFEQAPVRPGSCLKAESHRQPVPCLPSR
jgi:hypothetical protein